MCGFNGAGFGNGGIDGRGGGYGGRSGGGGRGFSFTRGAHGEGGG